MKRSESIAELTKALCKAQGEMTGAIKDSKNPFFKSTYADLASVWDACRKPLSDNGLCVIQAPEMIDNGCISVETLLSHESGEWVSCLTEAIPPNKKDKQGNETGEKDHNPQMIGKLTTYLRRYGLAAMVGIAQVDDDAEAAMGRNGKPKECLDADQIDHLIKLMEDAGLDLESVHRWLVRLAKRFGVANHSQIHKEDFSQAEQVIIRALSEPKSAK